MKILALSDRVVAQIYSSRVTDLFRDVRLVLGCGDLPDYYLEYVVSMLNVPFFHYVDFDRTFLPKNDRIAGRWQNVDRAFYEDISLPPVVLYKVGDVYCVVDGHHRVSVARQQGQAFNEAEVRERQVRFP